MHIIEWFHGRKINSTSNDGHVDENCTNGLTPDQYIFSSHGPRQGHVLVVLFRQYQMSEWLSFKANWYCYTVKSV